MKFKGSLEISKPRDFVVRMFMDPAYLREYQDGFVRKEVQKGAAGEVGTVSTLYYSYGGRDMVLKETIVANDLPHSFEAFYHHKHMDNTMHCVFTELDPQTTLYEYAFEYTRINWFMPRLMAILFPGMYRKQGEKWMKQFKDFVEKQLL